MKWNWLCKLGIHKWAKWKITKEWVWYTWVDQQRECIYCGRLQKRTVK